MNWPKISIVTPVYNNVQYIRETVESVLNQRYPNLEYIVMDGGSNDGTLQILEEYRDEIAILQSGPDGGQSSALVKAFEMASGEIFSWLNGDDYFFPGTLRKVGEQFAHDQELDLVYGDYLVLTEEGRFEAKPKVKFDFLICLYSYLMIPQPSSFWSKEMYRSVGGINPKFNYSFDWDLFLRFGAYLKGKRAESICHNHDIYSVFRLHEASKSVSEKEKFVEERDEIIDQFSQYNPRRFRSLKKKYYLLKVLRNFATERGFIPIRGDRRKA